MHPGACAGAHLLDAAMAIAGDGQGEGDAGDPREVRGVRPLDRLLEQRGSEQRRGPVRPWIGREPGSLRRSRQAATSTSTIESGTSQNQRWICWEIPGIGSGHPLVRSVPGALQEAVDLAPDWVVWAGTVRRAARRPVR